MVHKNTYLFNYYLNLNPNLTGQFSSVLKCIIEISVLQRGPELQRKFPRLLLQCLPNELVLVFSSKLRAK